MYSGKGFGVQKLNDATTIYQKMYVPTSNFETKLPPSHDNTHRGSEDPDCI